MDPALKKEMLRAARPRSLNGLMSLYESNFRRLQRLIPDMDFPFDSAVSVATDDRDLHLAVLDRARYTTTLKLTYQFEEDGSIVDDPELRVRVYADARLVEALRVDPSTRCQVLSGMDPTRGNFIMRRWSRNLMLNKWLEYCLAKGHGFAMANRPRSKGRSETLVNS